MVRIRKAVIPELSVYQPNTPIAASTVQVRTIERQELHCHACDKYVQFDLDLSLNGRHVLACPNCGHEHCRVVNNGVISDERWEQRNGPVVYPMYTTPTYYVSTATISISTYSNFNTSTSTYLSDAWLQTTIKT